MSLNSIAEAERAFVALTRFGVELRSAASLDEANNAWSGFLNESARVYEKIGKFRPTQQFKDWWQMKLSERKTDELLCYLQHARNSDFHTLEPVSSAALPGFGIWPSGFTVIDHIIIKEGVITHLDARAVGPHSGVDIRPIQGIFLTPAKDRGVEYPVPAIHLGKAISPEFGKLQATFVIDPVVAHHRSMINEATEILNN